MLTILSQDYEVLGVLQNKSNSLGYWDDLHIENLDVGAETYEFFTLANHPMSENIQIGNMVAIKNLDDETVLFTIMDIEDDHSDGKFNMKVYCEQAGLQLLNEIEVPYSDSYKPLSFYANKALLWTTWEIGEVESESNLSLTFEENESVYKRLQRIASEFNMEIHFTIEMNGARVTAKKVHFKKQRGNVSGKRFEYTKDITRVFRKRNGYNLITAVKGIGKTDENGVTTTFKDTVFDDGDFYTEAGSDVIYSRSALERWGRQGGNIWGLFEFDTSNAQNLFTRALRHLKKNINPEITYEIDVVLLERVAGYADEKVRIGDTIRVTDFEFSPPLLLEARVVQLETSYTDPSKDKAILGDYKRIDSTISDELRAIQATLMKKEAIWSQIGETILKQPTPPSNPENGDLWLDTSKNPAVIYVYDNPDWIPTSLDPSLLDDLQDQITAVEISVNGKETYVPKSATAPSSPTDGMLWLDTSSTPNQLKVYLSGSWESATPDNVYIEDKVQEEVDKIEIGGENIISNSAPDTLIGWESVPASTGTIEIIDELEAPLDKALQVTFDSTMTGVKIMPNKTLSDGESYTWSVWIKASKALSMSIGNQKGGMKSVSVTTSWVKHDMTFTATGSEYAMLFSDNLNGMNAGDILYIHSLKLEKGTKPTSWSASSREIKEDVSFLVEKTNELDQQVSESAITTTIFNSTKYTEDLAKKANTEDIADMATQGELAETAEQLQENIDKKADDSRVNQAFDQISQVQQTAQDFQFKLQASGGINLLKNSVGYADFKAWTKTGTVQTYVNEDFTKFGSDSVFNFVNGSIEQTALIQSNNFHTLNYVVTKPSTGTLTITIYDGGVSVGSKTYTNGTSYTQMRDKITVQALSNALTVQITGTAGQVGVLMLNIGSEPLQWQQAHDEIYTSNVQFDQSGITVKSTAYNGYTVISPDEFAGYAEVIDDNGVASIQKIFTLNGDTTEVNKLDVKKQISMGQMKVIDVNGTKKGWAFIKNQ